MSAWLRVGCASFVAASIVVASAPVAYAADEVTLAASRPTITIGQKTRLTGQISTGAAGETVTIRDQDGKVRGQDVTNSSGEYSVVLQPKQNAVLQAEWSTATSPKVKIRVRPIVKVGLSNLHMFLPAPVRGTVRPAVSGTILLKLMNNGRRVARKRTAVNDGRFRSKFRIMKPGSHRVVAVFDHETLAPRRSGSAPASAPLPGLSQGSRSVDVRGLEWRLRNLAYRLPGVNKAYDARTSDAIRAFNKVQGRARVGSVSESTWRALASPRRPKPRSKFPRYHIEVDQTKQVLYRVRRGRIITIVHVSTGAGGATRDGRFTFFRRVDGYSPNKLYYPVYFDGLRAIHGWPSVPTYPASHGCVRVPMWTAKWLSRKVDLGNKIFIYH